MSFARSSSNWLEAAAAEIARRLPPLSRRSEALAERLAALLIQRLPEHWSRQLLSLLPSVPAALGQRLQPTGDSALGYPEFVEAAAQTLAFAPGLELQGPEHSEELALGATEAFFVALAAHLPRRIARDLAQVLPPDLGSRFGEDGLLPAA